MATQKSQTTWMCLAELPEGGVDVTRLARPWGWEGGWPCLNSAHMGREACCCF